MSSRVFYLRLKRLTSSFYPDGDIVRYTVPDTPSGIASFWAAVADDEFGPVDVLTDVDDKVVAA